MFFQKAAFSDTMIFNIAHLKSLENIFSSPINFDYWNHSGSQINLFSPWLTILSGFIFLNTNISYGFATYLTLITFLTFVSAYYYMKRFSKDTFESLLVSVIYTFSLNRFFQVFLEQRIENYLVMIFLPMVYYGLFCFLKNKDWHLLTWGMLLVIWTSPYMAIAVLLTIILAIPLMIFSKTTHHWKYWGQLILNGLLLLGMTFLTTIGFIGPLFLKQWQTKFRQAGIKNPNFVTMYQNLNLSLMKQYLLLGILILLVLLLLLIFLKSNFSYKIILIEMIPLILSLFYRLKIPGIEVSRLYPALLGILDLFLTIIVSRIIIMIFQETSSVWKLLLVIAFVSGLSLLVFEQAQQLNFKKTLSTSENVNYEKFVLDYHDHASQIQPKFLANGKKTKVTFYTKKSDYWIQYYNPKSVQLDLPIQRYDGYRVHLNNESVKVTTSKRQTLQLRTHPGKNIIEIHSRYNLISILLLLINLVGFIGLGYLSLKKFVWKTKKSSYNG
ncbi:hypothetical protein FHL05_03190 [Lactobacillus halodurans]|nr:hypothetical protein [Companilactobacillus halodurans]